MTSCQGPETNADTPLGIKKSCHIRIELGNLCGGGLGAQALGVPG